jgi:hypothetical protein
MTGVLTASCGSSRQLSTASTSSSLIRPAATDLQAPPALRHADGLAAPGGVGVEQLFETGEPLPGQLGGIVEDVVGHGCRLLRD